MEKQKLNSILAEILRRFPEASSLVAEALSVLNQEEQISVRTYQKNARYYQVSWFKSGLVADHNLWEIWKATKIRCPYSLYMRMARNLSKDGLVRFEDIMGKSKGLRSNMARMVVRFWKSCGILQGHGSYVGRENFYQLAEKAWEDLRFGPEAMQRESVSQPEANGIILPPKVDTEAEIQTIPTTPAMTESEITSTVFPKIVPIPDSFKLKIQKAIPTKPS